MLYVYNTSTKKYTCEMCTDTPETFLRNTVIETVNENLDIISNNTNTIPDTRYDVLENKINSLSVVLEKFDLQTLAENLHTIGNKLEVTSNKMTANMKSISSLEESQKNSKNSTNVVMCDVVNQPAGGTE